MMLSVLGVMTDKVNHRTMNEAIMRPEVAYRETLVRATEIDYTHRKQTGPKDPKACNEFSEQDYRRHSAD
jgi:hypothetical protein